MKSLFTIVLASIVSFATAQNVGINTNSPATTLQVVGVPATTTIADGIGFPQLTGDQLRAKDAMYTTTQRGTVVYITAVGTSSPKTVNVKAAGFYYFNGTVWMAFSSGPAIGDIKSGLQTGDHSGWIRLDGRLRSSLSPTQQTAASTLGIGTNLPNALNAVPVQNGGTLGSVAGSMTKNIERSQLPNVNLTGNTGNGGVHNHGIAHVPNATGGWPSGTVNAFKHMSAGEYTNENDIATTDRTNGSTYKTASLLQDSGNHSHSISINLNGNVTQEALDITPRTLSVNVFIYLGN